ncbi:MAG: c-type cytochrome [Planctomycetes bacterium]|jgi:cytochrome c peroxidase|nr:c-type cytochrome [Planctomycetota bacterium]
MRILLPLSLSLSFLTSCSSDPAKAATVDDPLVPPRGLEAAALVTSADNPLTAAKAALGKQLFFDPRLSGSGKMGCNGCHYPEQAFTDGKALSVKDDGKSNTRNSPTMHNVGYLDRLYWDGRAKSLEGNVGAAWKAQLGAKPEEVAARLAAVPAYTKAFQDAFGAPPSETTIVQALASFLRTLRSGDSAYDRFQAGQKDALSADAKAGMDLFQGKAGCVICHTPPLFTNKLFHNVGIGMSAENPDVGAAAKNAFDDPAKKGQFKTPTLRDVAKTGPYFHDGSVATLKEAVKLMAGGGLANPNKDPLLADRGLTDAEIDQLVAFLEALSGNQKFTPPVVPQ